MNIIEVKNLNRSYGKKKVLTNVTFNVKPGEVYGVLGPNGAGKTTLIKILTTLLIPTSGEVFIFNKNIIEYTAFIRKSINFMFGGESGFYLELNAKEYLQYFSLLYKQNIDNNQIENLLNLVGLNQNKNQKAVTFSKGMKQRLHIARTLINNPKIIFLDEPTIGLDPVIAEDIRKLILELRDEKITTILTTHYMKEADDLCDNLSIIKDGKIIIQGTTDYIKNSQSIKNYSAILQNLRSEAFLNEQLLFSNIRINKLELDIYSVNFSIKKDAKHSKIISTLELFCTSILNLKELEVTLEDAYLNLVR
ncbi:ABC transporter ATP-binding protein [Bacillus velezensis]|uniref:ABC transporter ATP-binding protein n=1 Tax=Bacillus velezensis TaxID=492670 RepID=UPI0039B0B9CE